MVMEGGADALTVAEVARRARSSVGSFYARFTDKDALLRSVSERFFAQADATVRAVLAPAAWRGAPLFEVLEESLRFTVLVGRERGRLIAAVATGAGGDPDMTALAERLSRTVADHFAAIIAASPERPRHPDPGRAVLFAVWMILSALESRSLHALHRPPLFTDAELVAELTNLCLAFLGIDRPAGTKPEAPAGAPSTR
jgi:AcrR family transcriptional regulator